MTHGSEDCLKCEEHKAWEERMKVLEKVPSMLSWMNYMKGALAVITAIIVVAFPVFYSHIMTIRAETSRAMEKQDENIKYTRDSLTAQISIIGQHTATISRDVAVFVAKSELRQDVIVSEITELKSGRNR
jgi:hypothetical protein